MSEYYKFTQNKKCEYFPCHPGVEENTFNCLFCYCPLYLMNKDCGGNFKILKNGIKDCTNCIIPHDKNGYERINAVLGSALEKIKNQNISK